MADEESIKPIITITTQVPGYYKCGHCALHFRTRAHFRTHEVTCLSLKQIRARATFATESESTTTTNAELLALVQQLALRLETAEHELSVLKRQQQRQQEQQKHKNPIHRDNLLQWLNGTARSTALLNGTALLKALPELLTPFSGWLPTFGRAHLALVFQHGFMDGMCAIIASIVASCDAPLCAYDEAPGTLFVYEQQPHDGSTTGAPEKAFAQKTLAWRPITHAEFEQFINRMQKRLMNEFVLWQQEHAARLHDPDFAEQYDANLLKVTGSGKAKSGGCSNRDMLMTRLKPKVYAAIKRSANAAGEAGGGEAGGGEASEAEESD
jgi:hypothetical protein